MRRAIPWLLLIGCGDEHAPGICDPAELADALATETNVSVGVCTVSGDFVVPAGVTLSGTFHSVINGDDVALTLMTGEQPARIENLAIGGGARAAVILRGAGVASLTNVSIRVETGIGLGAEDLAALSLSEVGISGPVHDGNQGLIPFPPDRNLTATHGIVAARIADLDLDGVISGGFAGAGVVLIDSQTRWNVGEAVQNLGLGLHVQGGRAELIDVNLSDTYRGTWGIETYGGAFTASAAVESTNLRVADNWYGMLQDGGTARHTGISVERNQNAGIWAQFTTSFDLEGTIADNDFAGMVAYGAQGVNIHDSTIEATSEVVRVSGIGAVMIGDGIQLVESTSGARLVNLDLVENERVGLLIELGGGSLDAMEISDVRIQQMSGGNGAVLQHGSAPVDWDDGCTRIGVTADQDRAVNDLDFADVVGPCGRPDPLPGLSAFGL
jgi:hypothetical protein